MSARLRIHCGEFGEYWSRQAIRASEIATSGRIEGDFTVHRTILMALAVWIGGIVSYLVFYAISTWRNQYRTKDD